MTMQRYDAIVLGTGGVGSAALFHLTKRGARALGLDRFPIGHDRGSSHGHSRLTRQAYFEHPDYVPLVRRAFELWGELEQAAGEQLYFETGLLEVGRPEGEVIRGVRESARLHGLAIENLAASEARRRFPQFHVDDDCEAVFEHRAGYLLVERCVEAHADQAARLGAEVVTGTTVSAWRADGSGVVVETDRGSYAADRLVIAAGAWSGSLLAELGIPLEVRRKPLYWYATQDDAYRPASGCPAFYYDLPHGGFYGIPQIDELGVKVAEHSGGLIVDDPLAVNRDVLADHQRVAQFVAEHLPRATTRRTAHAVCMYTMSPDAHFIVDRHPAHPQVAFAAGLSGHGFKFTCALGQALAELALDGRTGLPIGFLSASRAALRASAQGRSASIS
jgi:sarcosine oxidase